MKKSTLAAVLGNIVSLLALALVNFGIELSAEEQANIVSALLLIVNTCALIIPAVLAGMKRSAPPSQSGHALPALLFGLAMSVMLLAALPGCAAMQMPTANNALTASSKALQNVAEDIGAAQKAGRITVEREAALLDQVQAANDELRRLQGLLDACQPAPCAAPADMLQRMNDEVVRIRGQLPAVEPQP